MKITDYGIWWKISVKVRGKWKEDLYLNNFDLAEVKNYDIFNKSCIFVIRIISDRQTIYASKLANSYDLRLFWHESIPLQITSYPDLSKKFLFSIKASFSKNKGGLSRRELFEFLRSSLSWRIP